MLKRKETKKRPRRFSNFLALAMFCSEPSKCIFRSGDFSRMLSRKKKRIERAFKKASTPEKMKGVEAEKNGRMLGLESTPPKNGPKINPRAKVAPIMPKARVRSSGAVESAIAA